MKKPARVPAFFRLLRAMAFVLCRIADCCHARFEITLNVFI
jgi:hypothetical protein